MATIEEIREGKKKAEEEYGKADKRLDDWNEGEDDGKWLKKLRRKLDNEEWKDEIQKRKWEESVKKLEEEKKLLEEEKVFWRGEVGEWGKKFREVGGWEGNEQIV